MNALNAPISFFDNCRDADNPNNKGTFLAVVTSGKLAKKYGPLLEKIRATNDPKQRKAWKEQLPGFTPSGIFSHRGNISLIQHSGLISFDLDSKQNPFLKAATVEAVKREIAKLPEVAFCGISASGTGLWGVIPIAHPDKHGEHFKALEAAFAGMGYIIDPACKEVARFRFWSYDPAPYINHYATPFTGLPKPVLIPAYAPRFQAGPSPDDLPAQAVEYLIKNRVTLECTYDSFRGIAFACKHHWGEDGKGYALEILNACTTFAQSNTARKFETLWMSARRNSGKVVTVGTLVHLAKEAGFKYTAQEPPQPAQQTNGHTWKEYTTTQGERYSLAMTPEGYPALWDDKRPTMEAAADLMRLHGWEAGRIEPATAAELEAAERMLRKAGMVTGP